MNTTDAKQVADYLATQGQLQRQRLEEIRSLVHALAPDVEEKISYGILGFFYRNKALVYVGGWESYVSMYPIPAAIADSEALATYQKGKGSLQFPNSQPLPIKFVNEVIAGHLARLS